MSNISLRLYVIGGFILFFLAIIAWFFLLRTSSSPSSEGRVPTVTRAIFPSGSPIGGTREPNQPYPTYPPTPAAGPGKQIVSGIPVNDLTPITPFNPQGDRMLAETDTYQIVYLPAFQQFILSITGTDLDRSRMEAERVFLQRLGIDAANACRLTVEVSVPNFVKNKYAGQTFPLSFCEHESDDHKN